MRLLRYLIVLVIGFAIGTYFHALPSKQQIAAKHMKASLVRVLDNEPERPYNTDLLLQALAIDHGNLCEDQSCLDLCESDSPIFDGTDCPTPIVWEFYDKYRTYGFTIVAGTIYSVAEADSMYVPRLVIYMGTMGGARYKIEDGRVLQTNGIGWTEMHNVDAEILRRDAFQLALVQLLRED